MSALKHLIDQGKAIVTAVHEPHLGRQLEGHTYWIRQGRLVQEEGEEPLARETYYELDCELYVSTHQALITRFSSVDWKGQDGCSMRRARLSDEINNSCK